GVPIGAKGEVLGILSFLTREEHQFSNEEVAFLYTVAGQAAIAIQNAQLYEQVERRTHELSALQSVTATASQSLDLDIVLREVIKKIREIFHFDATRIFLFDPQMDELHLRASFEAKPEPWAQVRVFRRGQGNAGRVAETGEPLIFEDVRSDPRYQKLSHTRTTQHAGFSFLGVFPIKSKLWTVGTIACMGQNPRRLTPGEIQLITSMAGQIGIAVENATLFQKTVTRAKELTALSRRLVEVQEAERRSIARELHDEVGQLLTGLKLTLNRSRRGPAGNNNDNFTQALTLVDELIRRVRDLSLDLRPAMLEDLGLLPVLLWHFEQYTAQTRVKVSFEHSGLNGQRFQLNVETAAYRIVQEALTNIARYAKVRKATVRVCADQSNLNVRVENQGVGFDPQAALAGGKASGLTGMRERAISLGGQLTIESAPGARSGTKLTADLPLKNSAGRRHRK
ncbi:MAG: GAF domain-containing sensor histidine kinase, partial [Deltaproteobacteria bacterium]|nr:GAF domain-containing sensor histidine kinase [Deltaproteobacteria bacterium]